MKRSSSLSLRVFASIFFINAPVFGDLNSDIRAILQDKVLSKGESAVAVARLRDGAAPEMLFRHNSDVQMIPASNLKIVTTSAALQALGKDFKFKTILAR